MSKLYFGKISKNWPEQFQENFYVGGTEETILFDPLEKGDFVFPIYKGEVSKLWKVREFTTDFDKIRNKGRIILFDEVNKFEKPINVQTEFSKYRFFNLDFNLLTKSIKSKLGGFFEISCHEKCPSPEEINFSDVRRIVIELEDTSNIFERRLLMPHEEKHTQNDLRIQIDNKINLNITDIQIFNGNNFESYEPLQSLYEGKNRQDERYSLSELLSFAKEDSRTNKEKYLSAVIKSLERNGLFIVSNPINLYDCVIAGRGKTKNYSASPKKIEERASAGFKQEPDEDLEPTELEEYESYQDLLRTNPNLILYGPPGTGKTYTAQRIVEYIEKKRTRSFKPFEQLLEDGRVEFITFHQSFSYEEFIEGIRPTLENTGQDQLQYKIEPGILKRLATSAEEDKAKPYVLIIDEINRGNISKIFGELITLLEKDKRDKLKIILPYSKASLTLPANLYIIGTMNTADRSIALLDTALRRRFTFREIMPDTEVIDRENKLISDIINLALLFETLNDRILKKYDRDHLLGHSYFLDLYDIASLKVTWYYQIIPLLMEYFYNDGECIAYVIGEAFIDKKTCHIKPQLKDEEFKKAILSIYEPNQAAE